ncbi:unnamed protein product [Dibothriocephalus latus]|uniref:Uncharacterized protein n=1 Tax=Dibothriocephalus latus TaxID=60516 RepID=A0A3P7PB36_DIBLA|nr:unnamed protein product [Dibothriocephalus latus]
MLNLAQNLGERVRDWEKFRDHDLHLAQCFNITTEMGVRLQEESLRGYCMAHIQSLLPAEPEDNRDEVLRVNALQGDLEVADPLFHTFPAFRIFLLTPPGLVRRPNPVLSCPGQQRLYVASAQLPAPSSSTSSLSSLSGVSTHDLLNSLLSPPERGSTRMNTSWVTRNLGNFDVLLAGAFSEDCDIF